MIVWEIKKLIKSKSTMVVSLIFILLCILMNFVNPVLETQNSYIDNNNNYIVDEREGIIIANEKLDKKVNELRNLQEMKNSKETDYFSKKKILVLLQVVNINWGSGFWLFFYDLEDLLDGKIYGPKMSFITS